jgi:hypothetical protein
MCRRGSLAIALLVAASLAGCDGPPNRPSHLDSFRLAGPAEVAPGTSTSFKALLDRAATLTDVSEEAQWVSSNPSVLSVDAGLATAHMAGDTTILARFEGQQTAPMSVLVLPPPGTYRLRGFVQDTGSFPLSMARVEVPAVGLATTTDAHGRFALYGVPQDAEIHVTKEGYASAVVSVHLVDHVEPKDFVLRVLYVLTVSPSSVAPGGELRVSWKFPDYYFDWIGLFRVGDRDDDYIDFQYTQGHGTLGEGTQIWIAPTQEGQYEFRYFEDGARSPAARSSPVTVVGASPTASDSTRTTSRRAGRGAAQRPRGR